MRNQNSSGKKTRPKLRTQKTQNTTIAIYRVMSCVNVTACVCFSFHLVILFQFLFIYLILFLSTDKLYCITHSMQRDTKRTLCSRLRHKDVSLTEVGHVVATAHVVH